MSFDLKLRFTKIPRLVCIFKIVMIIHSGPWPLGEHDVKKRSHDCPMALSFIININFTFRTCLLSVVVISDADKLLVSNPAK